MVRARKNSSKRIGFIILTAVILCAIWLPCTVFAGNTIKIWATGPSSIKKGDEVQVTIRLANNTGIQTMGLCLEYDASILQYVKEQWSSNVENTNGVMKLVSDVNEGGKQRLYISFICDSQYGKDGEFVTLKFKALQDYNTVPAKLLLEELTNESEDITQYEVVEAIQTASSGSGSDGSGGGQENDGNPSGGQGNGGGNSSDVNNGNGNSSDGNGSTGGDSSNSGSYDNTYQTGIFDWPGTFAIIGAICVAAAIGCGVHMRKLQQKTKR